MKIEGDGVDCNGKSLNCISYSGILGQGSTVETHWLAFSYFAPTAVKDDVGHGTTKEKAWARFICSFLHCEKGYWPLDDPDMESIDIQNQGKLLAD